MRLDELALAARRYAAAERRLFEVLGAWVLAVPEPDVKLALRVHSFQHAWHAELWDGLAPLARGLEASREPAEPGSEEEVVDVLANAEGTVGRLAAAYRTALPALVAEYLSMRDSAAPASDGPLLRVLSLVLADEERALDEGERLLAALEASSGMGYAERAPEATEAHLA